MLQVLGCGVMQQAILDDAGRNENRAWAFGYTDLLLPACICVSRSLIMRHG